MAADRFVGGEVALRKRDFGVVLRRAGVGRRVGFLGRAAGHHQRIERRHRVGEGIRRQRQRRRQDRERPHPHDFLVADLDRRRRLVGLLGGDDVDRPDQPVALARIDAFGLLVAGEIGEFRRLGEIRLAVEIEVERCADQRQAGEAGERHAGEPAQRDAPPLAAVDARFADLDRRLVAELDDRAEPVGRPGGAGDAGGGSRHVRSCSLARCSRPGGPLSTGAAATAQRAGGRFSAKTMAVVRRAARRDGAIGPIIPRLGPGARANCDSFAKTI